MPGGSYDLTVDAWRGHINGHRPKLTHKKALTIQTTIFDKRAYDGGLREAMREVIDEFTYPGIKNVEHEYFFAVRGAADAQDRAIWKARIRWVTSSERSTPEEHGGHPRQRHVPGMRAVIA
jgi:hypothetical protein